jgi:hypothetical protein
MADYIAIADQWREASAEAVLLFKSFVKEQMGMQCEAADIRVGCIPWIVGKAFDVIVKAPTPMHLYLIEEEGRPKGKERLFRANCLPFEDCLVCNPTSSSSTKF